MLFPVPWQIVFNFPTAVDVDFNDGQFNEHRTTMKYSTSVMIYKHLYVDMHSYTYTQNTTSYFNVVIGGCQMFSKLQSKRPPLIDINLHCTTISKRYQGTAIQPFLYTDRCQTFLTHWGRVTHICVDKLTINGSDNGLSPGQRQAII